MWPAILHAKEKVLRNDSGIKVVISFRGGQKKEPYGFRYLLIMAAIWVEAHAQVAHAQAAQPGVPVPIEQQ